MSLVNLAHVCSHLQNASLARLGLTSIPYSKLHLSLALLLHKQGFLSHVKLAGPSPPASCFPPGTRENTQTVAQPRLHSPEGALRRVLSASGPVTEEILRTEGYPDTSIAFALENRYKDVAQLTREGWAEAAADILAKYGDKSAAQLLDEGKDETLVAIIEELRPSLAYARSEAEHSFNAEMKPGEKIKAVESARREVLLQNQLPAHVLRYFAGSKYGFRTIHDLVDDDLTLEQIYDPPPPPKQQDPWQLEAEGIVTQANRASRRLWLGLKYWDGVPVLQKASMLSKPTKRIWVTSRECDRLSRGKDAAKGEVKGVTRVGECMFLTTDLGVMEVREAAERRSGGMVLCRVW